MLWLKTEEIVYETLIHFAVQRPYLFLILQPSSATESYLLLKDTVLKYQQKYCHGIRYNSKKA